MAQMIMGDPLLAQQAARPPTCERRPRLDASTPNGDSTNPHSRQSDQRLPIKWAVIIGFGTACGIAVGQSQGLAAGLGTALAVIGVLAAIL